MKISNIIGLGLVLTCSFSTFAQTQKNLEKNLAKASEIFVGTWTQSCDNTESTLKFDAKNKVKFSVDKKTKKGTWEINEKDNLVLNFKKQKQKQKEQWQITKLTANKFTITKDDVTCTGKKTS